MQEKQKQEGSWLEVFRTFAWAVVIAMILRSFLFQPFHIPSGSMKPTLLVGDYLIVSKYSYGYSRYSFPFGLHLFDGRLMAHQPERGDIVVFKVPSNPSSRDVLIKRIIGLPGDKLQVKQGYLYVNGQKLTTEPDGEFYDKDIDRKIPRLVETLPNGVKHWTLYAPRNTGGGDVEHYNYFDKVDPDNTAVYTVPEGHFFMMGDNRDNSEDSRYSVELGGPGFVAFEDLIGRAEVVLVSSGGSWNPLNWGTARSVVSLRKFNPILP